MTHTPPSATVFDRWKQPFGGRSATIGAAAILSLLAAALTMLLWPQWGRNPELAHGFFMPILWVVLLHEGATAGHPRHLADSSWNTAAVIGLGLAALGLTIFGGLYALSFDWSHALACSAPAAAFVCLGLATLLVFARRSVALLPFNWTTVLAFGLWLLCAPLPPGTYQRLSLHLQLGVTHGVIVALHLLGVPAVQHGNVIELTRTAVGVEEACSGIRSLISCLFAGAFFSACVVRRPWGRLVLIALAGPLALLMNFLRSLILTLLANAGINIEGAWHDATGYAILVVTAALLGWLAMMLARSKRPAPSPAEANVVGGGVAPRAALAGLLGGLGLTLALAVFLVAWTRPISVERHRAPDLAQLVPADEAASGWNVRTESDLERFSSILQTHTLIQRDYLRRDADGPTRITLYLAYWAPGQSTPSQVAIHTPDGCWPGAGWVPVPERIERQTLTVGGRTLAPAEYRVFTSQGGAAEQVWYWHLYDHRPIEQLNAYAVPDLLRMALRYGFHRGGEQLFVRISSNRPWDRIAREPLVVAFLQRLQPQGL